MWFMAFALWPPHSPPACCRSLYAPLRAVRADSTSAGTSCCGDRGNSVAVGTRMVAASTRVEIFICSSDSGADSKCSQSAIVPSATRFRSVKRPWRKINSRTHLSHGEFVDQPSPKYRNEWRLRAKVRHERGWGETLTEQTVSLIFATSSALTV